MKSRFDVFPLSAFFDLEVEEVFHLTQACIQPFKGPLCKYTQHFNVVLYYIQSCGHDLIMIRHTLQQSSTQKLGLNLKTSCSITAISHEGKHNTLPIGYSTLCTILFQEHTINDCTSTIRCQRLIEGTMTFFQIIILSAAVKSSSFTEVKTPIKNGGLKKDEAHT